MPSRYRPEELRRHDRRYQDVAADLFNRVRAQAADRCFLKPGSYTIRPSADQHSNEAVAKIVIYEPWIRRATDWPVRDGVYILTRASGLIGDLVWDGNLRRDMPRMFKRMWRGLTVVIGPNDTEEFSYFPVVAGDDTDSLVSLLVACSRL